MIRHHESYTSQHADMVHFLTRSLDAIQKDDAELYESSFNSYMLLLDANNIYESYT